MRKIEKISLLFIMLCASFQANAQLNGPAKHVILVTVDGMRPAFYLDDSWPAFTMRQLANEGISALGMRPVNPSTTVPDHTTLITGALPVNHGVFHNQPFRMTAETPEAYRYADQILAETLWDAVRKSGGTSASVNWPVSVNAPVDWNFRTYQKNAVFPESFLASLEQELLGHIPETYSRGTDFDRYDSDLRLANVGAYIIEKHRPNLMTIHFSGTDAAQHEQGLEGDKVRKTLAVADIGVNLLIEATRKAGIFDSTVFIICGDHGFENRHTQLAWNALLIKEGLLENKPDGGNWKAWFKDQFLMLKDPHDTKTLQQVRALIENQPASIRKLYRIVERDELDQYGTDPNAVLGVHPVEGVVCTSRMDHPDLVQSTPGGSHGLMPDRPSLNAGFIAIGPGLRKKMIVPELRIEDVAPLVSFSLGIPFDCPDGVLYPGMIAEEIIKGY